MNKKHFTLLLESSHPFPDDLYNDSDLEEVLQDHLDSLNWVFPNGKIKKVWVTVEAIE